MSPRKPIDPFSPNAPNFIGESSLDDALEFWNPKGWTWGRIEDFKRREELAEHREFTSGATRDKDNGKIDYEGFLSPLVIEAFGNFMHYNRLMKDGSYRDSDNWQKGIPLGAYMKSGWRHFKDWWSFHRDAPTQENIVFAICGVIFNAQGYLHELLKEHPKLLEASIKEMEDKRK